MKEYVIIGHFGELIGYGKTSNSLGLILINLSPIMTILNERLNKGIIT